MDKTILRGKITNIRHKKESWFAGSLYTFDPIIKYNKILEYNRSWVNISGSYYGDHNLVNSYVTLYGSYIYNEVNGKIYKNFKIDKIEVTKDDILFNFIKEFIKYFNDDSLQKVITFKKYELLNWLNNGNINYLKSIKGVGIKKAQKIVENWNRHKDKFKLFELLGSTFNNSIVDQIYRYYIDKHQYNIDNIIDILKNNPYNLLEIDGLGFKRVDSFALYCGIDKMDPRRIEEFIKYKMNIIINQYGHTIIKHNDIKKEVENNLKELDIDYRLFTFNKYINSLIHKKILTHFKIDNNFVYIFTHILEKEKYIYEKLKNHNRNRNIFSIKNIDKYIEDREKKFNIKYSNKQIEAIKTINENNVVIIKGYAGTGKSFISKTLLDMFVVNKIVQPSEIIVTALSGIATDKIKKYSGYNGDTIMGLKYKKKKHYIKNSDTLKYKIVMIDEASMINLNLFYNILSSISSNSKIIIVGDPGQLPPIGPGDIFNNIIDLNIVPIVSFDEIFRNSNYELNSFANSIRKHYIPKNFKTYNNLNFIDIKNDNNIINDYIKNSGIYSKLKELLKNGQYIEYLEELQLITPIKKGNFGIIKLNSIVKDFINSSDNYVEFKYNKDGIKYKYKFSIGDKIVHNKNVIIKGRDLHKSDLIRFIANKKCDYDYKVYNGMIGIIANIDFEEETIYVIYPFEKYLIKYSFVEAKNYIDLGYVITVHKSQGSGFNHIIYIQGKYSSIPFYNNKLIYTALTRTKKDVTIFSKDDIFTNTVNNRNNIERLTLLKMLKDRQ